jgi:hypothetical protein
MKKAALGILTAGLVAIALWWIARPAPELPQSPAAASDPAAAPVAAPEVPDEPQIFACPELPKLEPVQRGQDPPRVLTPSDPDSVIVTGRVVDERRRPVPGADVGLFVGSRPAVRARTGPDGTFRLVAEPERSRDESVGVVARDGKGRAGVARTWLRPPPRSRESGPPPILVVLEPAFPFEVRVTAAGAPADGAVVRAFHGELRTPVALERTGPDGVARMPELPHGDLLLAVFDPQFRRAEARLRLPRPEPGPLAIELAESRTISVLVVEAGTGKALPGVRIAAQLELRSPGMNMNLPFSGPEPIAPTNAEGRTRIVGVGPKDRLSVRALVTDEPTPPWGPPGATAAVPPDASEVRIEVHPHRVVRWPVTAGDAPIPEEGAVLRLRPIPGGGGSSGKDARIEGGQVVALFPPGYGSATAVAPDGSLARLWVQDGSDTGQPTSFFRPRTLEVVVRDESGNPQAGVAIHPRQQGNNPVADPLTTDAEGRVRFDGLLGDHLDAWAGDAGRGNRLGSADLRKGDGRIEGTLLSPRELLVRVRIEGQPGLPGRLGVQADGQPAQIVAEDPEDGELRCSFRPRKSGVATVPVHLVATGFVTAPANAAPRESDGVFVAEVDLRPGGAWHVRVIAPKDNVYELTLQKEEPGPGWRHTATPGRVFGRPEPDADGILRLAPLDSGRYRLVENRSGLASDPIDVVAGAPPIERTFDLSQVAWIRGQLIAPEGASPAGGRVVVDGRVPERGSLGGARGEPIQKDGRFRLRAGAFPVTLRAWHPVLAPSPEGGVVTLASPREDVVLRLGRGPTLSFRPVPAPATQRLGPVRVLVFHGEPTGAPVSEHSVVLDGGVARCGGFAPGRVTLWIDVPDLAPLVKRDVELADGETDLGEVALGRGSSVRIRLETRAGASPPRVHVFASSTSGPSYSRQTNSNGDGDVVLRGLGAGRFRLRVNAIMDAGGAPPMEQEVVVDGVNDVLVPLDLR